MSDDLPDNRNSCNKTNGAWFSEENHVMKGEISGVSLRLVKASLKGCLAQ